MKIARFSFGKLIVDSVKYHSDLIIEGDRIVQPKWWRKEGHLLQLIDIEEFLKEGLKILLVGRGFSSRMRIDNDLQLYLLEKGVVLQALSTPEACQRYNELKHQNLLACFHLTC